MWGHVISDRSRNSLNIIGISTNAVCCANIDFHLRHSVCQGNLGSYFILAMISLTICKIPHLKICNGLKMTTTFLRPCQGKLAGGFHFLGFYDVTCTHFQVVRKPRGILKWGFLLRAYKMGYYPRFIEIHSSQQEMELSHLLEESSFVNLLRSYVIKYSEIVREPWGFFR